MNDDRDERFQTNLASKIAYDLTEKYIASNIADMMIPGARETARRIREICENHLCLTAKNQQEQELVQEFLSTARIAYSVILDLLEGSGGYKLVSQE